jgi:hypothetical protein
LRLRPIEWSLFLQAWFWLLVFEIGLRVLSFQHLRAYAEKVRWQADPQEATAIISQTIQAVERARRAHLIPMTCLRRSLTLQYMLGMQGIKTQLKIGVAKSNGELIAHAWLEADKTLIGEREVVYEKFSILDIHK